MNTVGKSLLGMALAAGAVYFFDPVSGRRRRVLLRDRFSRAARAADLQTRDVRHDLSHRMHDFAASARTHFNHSTSDKAIGRNVHQALKRAVAHPDAIGFAVSNGNVFLRGEAYSHEHQRVLDEIRAIPGLRVLTDHLTLREAAEGVRPLPNAAGKIGGGWSMVGRLMAGAGGCALVLWGVRERKALGEAGTSVGQAVRRFSRMEPSEQVEHVERVIDDAVDAAEGVHRRMWQGERPDSAPQSRAAH